MNRLIALQNYTKGPLECQTATAWLRRLSYQQFPYQHKPRKADIGRQFLLFSEGGPAQKLGRIFSKTSGISIRDFSLLCFSAIVHALAEKEHSISSDWFRRLKDEVTAGAPEQFLHLLINTGPFKKPGHESDYYEQSTLFSRPLIAHSKKRSGITYEYLHKSHISEALRDFIYDHLKSEDANGFMGQFGEAFSRYIESLLSEAALQSFLSERELKNIPTFRASKVVDFVVYEPNASILIEAKAIATTPTTRSTASAATLGKRLRDSLLKAIDQARKTAINLSKESQRDFFLIIVTYKQLYLATGPTIRDCISKEILTELDTDHAETSLLPFENIFVFSIDELERLLAAMTAKKTTFATFLTAVKKRQTDPKQMKFVISQHLDIEEFFEFPVSLEKHVANIFEELGTVLKGH